MMESFTSCPKCAQTEWLEDLQINYETIKRRCDKISQSIEALIDEIKSIEPVQIEEKPKKKKFSDIFKKLNLSNRLSKTRDSLDKQKEKEDLKFNMKKNRLSKARDILSKKNEKPQSSDLLIEPEALSFGQTWNQLPTDAYASPELSSLDSEEEAMYEEGNKIATELTDCELKFSEEEKPLQREQIDLNKVVRISFSPESIGEEDENSLQKVLITSITNQDEYDNNKTNTESEELYLKENDCEGKLENANWPQESDWLEELGEPKFLENGDKEFEALICLLEKILATKASPDLKLIKLLGDEIEKIKENKFKVSVFENVEEMKSEDLKNAENEITQELTKKISNYSQTSLKEYVQKKDSKLDESLHPLIYDTQEGILSSIRKVKFQKPSSALSQVSVQVNFETELSVSERPGFINETFKKTLIGHCQEVRALALLKNGDLASCSVDSLINIWSVSTLQVKQSLYGHTGKVMCIKVLNRNGFIVSGSSDRTLKVWNPDANDKSKFLVKTIAAHKSTIHSLALFPDDVIISASYDKTIALWDPNKDYARISVIRRFKCNQGTLKTVSKSELLAASQNKIYIWNRWILALSGTKAKTLDCPCGYITKLEILNNQKFAVGSHDGKVLIFNSEKFCLNHTINLTGKVLSIHPLIDSQNFLCLSNDANNADLLKTCVISSLSGEIVADLLCNELGLDCKARSFLLSHTQTMKEGYDRNREYSLFGCKNHTICYTKFNFGS